MKELEGVIKYHLKFSQSKPVQQDLKELNCWRSILYGLGLIGQDDLRYGGFGFGNLSQRYHRDKTKFIISGTQTGNLAELTRSHYVCIESCEVAENIVIASGPVKPSSEALTHSMFYELDPSIECVIHIHSAKLWQYGLQHEYPCTDKSIQYGTQEMATEITRLFKSGRLQKRKTLVMAGHEDGVICFGDSVEQAAIPLIHLWVNSNLQAARYHSR